jgi:hypothetical protein
MFLHPGLLWLTLNLALIIQRVLRNNMYIYFFSPILLIPITCFRVPPGLRLSQVEDHWYTDLEQNFCSLRANSRWQYWSTGFTHQLSGGAIFNVVCDFCYLEQPWDGAEIRFLHNVLYVIKQSRGVELLIRRVKWTGQHTQLSGNRMMQRFNTDTTKFRHWTQLGTGSI